MLCHEEDDCTPQQLQGQPPCVDLHTLVQSLLSPISFLFCILGNHQPGPVVNKSKNEYKTISKKPWYAIMLNSSLCKHNVKKETARCCHAPTHKEFTAQIDILRLINKKLYFEFWILNFSSTSQFKKWQWEKNTQNFISSLHFLSLLIIQT